MPTKKVRKELLGSLKVAVLTFYRYGLVAKVEKDFYTGEIIDIDKIFESVPKDELDLDEIWIKIRPLESSGPWSPPF